jgi:hypothetical protein
MRNLFRFPDPVNEVSARTLAAGVVVLTLLVVLSRQPWLLAVLAYGFVARVLTGPTLSPWGQIVTRVIVPRLPFESRYVPGPPKRFAQGIGATLSVAALVTYLVTGSWTVPLLLVLMITLAATLESVFGLCLGCKIFAVLMRVGVIPASVCERCNDLSLVPRAGRA